MPCEPRCLECEVDGMPIDPVWWAERQVAEAEGRRAALALLDALSDPIPSGVVPAATPMTPRERGALRRAQLDARDHAAAFGRMGIALNDRRHSRMGRRGGKSRRSRP